MLCRAFYKPHKLLKELLGMGSFYNLFAEVKRRWNFSRARGLGTVRALKVWELSPKVR